MPKIIDRTTLLSDYVDSIKGIKFTSVPDNYRGRFSAFITDQEQGNVVASIHGLTIEFNGKYKKKFLKPLLDSLARYEKDSSVETTLIINP